MLNYDDPLWAPLKDLFDVKVPSIFDPIIIHVLTMSYHLQN